MLHLVHMELGELSEPRVGPGNEARLGSGNVFLKVPFFLSLVL